MSRTIRLRCRASLGQALHSKTRSIIPSIRAYSSQTEETETPQAEASKSHKDTVDVAALLSKPTWSVRSLLASSSSEAPKQEITPSQLHHLLRLSALPQPSSAEAEAKMLETLHSQLHFVRDIQSVDTEGVEPLQSIRDETEEGIKEATIGMQDLRDAFREEEIRGRNRRPRRKRTPVVEKKDVKGWDVLQTAGETVSVGAGRYFVVRSGKDAPKEKTPTGGVPKVDSSSEYTLKDDIGKDDTQRE